MQERYPPLEAGIWSIDKRLAKEWEFFFSFKFYFGLEEKIGGIRNN